MSSNNTDELIDNFRKNGIAVIEQITEPELSSMIEAANIAYYNTKKQVLSDTEYDIIKEYLDASNFFLEDSQTKYLNAILDKVAKKIRIINE